MKFSKILSKFSIGLLVFLICFIGVFESGFTTPSKLTISGHPGMVINVNLGEKLTLPSAMWVIMSDHTDKLVTVTWKDNTFNTSKIGSFTYYGTFVGYNNKVTLTVVVKSVVKSNYMSDILTPFNKILDSMKINPVVTLMGEQYTKGYSLHLFNFKDSQIDFNLTGKYSNITGLVGIDDHNGGNTERELTLEVYSDGNLLNTYNLIQANEPQVIDIDVTGTHKLSFVFKLLKTVPNVVDLVDLKIK
jgi:hypothetical protein